MPRGHSGQVCDTLFAYRRFHSKWASLFERSPGSWFSASFC